MKPNPHPLSVRNPSAENALSLHKKDSFFAPILRFVLDCFDPYARAQHRARRAELRRLRERDDLLQQMAWDEELQKRRIAAKMRTAIYQDQAKLKHTVASLKNEGTAEIAAAEELSTLMEVLEELALDDFHEGDTLERLRRIYFQRGSLRQKSPHHTDDS